MTPDRFYVHDSLHDAFVEGFAARASALKVGDGLAEGTQHGAIGGGGEGALDVGTGKHGSR